MLTNSVFPPVTGTSLAERIEVWAGIRLKELSACHCILALLTIFSRSANGAMRLSSPMFERMTSGLPAPRVPVFVVSSGPNRWLNAICSASLMSYLGNTSTENSVSALRNCANISSLIRLVRSTPSTIAPKKRCNGRVAITRKFYVRCVVQSVPWYRILRRSSSACRWNSTATGSKSRAGSGSSSK